MKLSQGKDSCMEELTASRCNPLGRVGVSLPPLRASLGRADPQQPQEGFASRGSSSLRGGSEDCVSFAPDAVLRHG